MFTFERISVIILAKKEGWLVTNHEVEKDVKEALRIIRNGFSVPRFLVQSDYSKVFAFSNEWIPGYLPYFSIANQPALTITGSLDQALFLAQNGASSIDAFDRNPLVKYYGELKLAAIRCLSREEFLEFIPTSDNPDASFSPKICNEIFYEMPEDAQKFWFSIYRNVKDSRKIANLFRTEMVPLISDANYYSEENYDNLQKRLNQINLRFYTADFSSLPQCILNKKGYYGTILLSNIFDWGDFRPYVAADYVTELHSFYSVVEHVVKPLLTDDGVCLARYYFGDHRDDVETFMEHHSLEDCPKEYVKVRGVPSVDLYRKSKFLGND